MMKKDMSAMKKKMGAGKKMKAMEKKMRPGASTRPKPGGPVKAKPVKRGR